jgi:hypothetical protein
MPGRAAPGSAVRPPRGSASAVPLGEATEAGGGGEAAGGQGARPSPTGSVTAEDLSPPLGRWAGRGGAAELEMGGDGGCGREWAAPAAGGRAVRLRGGEAAGEAEGARARTMWLPWPRRMGLAAVDSARRLAAAGGEPGGSPRALRPPGGLELEGGLLARPGSFVQPEHVGSPAASPFVGAAVAAAVASARSPAARDGAAWGASGGEHAGQAGARAVAHAPSPVGGNSWAARLHAARGGGVEAGAGEDAGGSPVSNASAGGGGGGQSRDVHGKDKDKELHWVVRRYEGAPQRAARAQRSRCCWTHMARRPPASRTSLPSKARGPPSPSA